MMARAKRLNILMIKVNKLIFFFASRYSLNEIENMFSVLRLVFPQYLSFPQTFTRVSIKQLYYELEISIAW